MKDEQRQQRLIAITMYYFGLIDGGNVPRLIDLQQLVDPDLHSDLMNLIAAVLDYQPGIDWPADQPAPSAALVHEALCRLRGERWQAQYHLIPDHSRRANAPDPEPELGRWRAAYLPDTFKGDV